MGERATYDRLYQKCRTRTKKAGKAPTRPLPTGAGAPRIQVDPLAVLHTPSAEEGEKIHKRQTHRLTVVAKNFIVECVVSGLSNQSISRLLRQKGFILSGEADLSRDTFRRLRGLPECRLDPGVMTAQARQVGHNALSDFAVYWADVGREALQRMSEIVRQEETVVGMTYKDALATATKASDYLHGTFALGIAERLKIEIEASLSPITDEMLTGTDRKPPAEQMAAYFEGVMAAAYERALAVVSQEQ